MNNINRILSSLTLACNKRGEPIPVRIGQSFAVPGAGTFRLAAGVSLAEAVSGRPFEAVNTARLSGMVTVDSGGAARASFTVSGPEGLRIIEALRANAGAEAAAEAEAVANA